MSVLFKLNYFVPESHLESTKTAIFKTGAGQLGCYDSCAWQTKGVGQFRPLEGSQPALGEQHQVNKVDEFKVEILVQQSHLQEAVAALRESHPYEEPAFELYQIYQMP
ncbi:MAG: NGG1p interacting factor NIF3 [Pseudomonadota bacterium]|nr:NGG1p interacting factor NIF3 [Pseudomonadota bacterium]